MIMDDIDWFCEFVNIDLYWYQKVRLSLDKKFCDNIKRMRNFVENYKPRRADDKRINDFCTMVYEIEIAKEKVNNLLKNGFI